MDWIQLFEGYRATARTHLFFTTQSPRVFGTHLINLISGMKD